MENNQMTSQLPAGFRYEDESPEEKKASVSQMSSPQLPPGFRYEDEESYFNPEMPAQETWGQTLTRVPIGLASSAVKGASKTADISSGILRYASEQVPESVKSGLSTAMPLAALGVKGFSAASELISEKNVEKGINKIVPKKYRDPKENFIERGLHKVAQEAPFMAAALATGGLPALGASAARAIGSAIGSESAKSAGFGEFAQAIGGLVGSFGYDIVKNPLHTLGKETQKKLDYATKNAAWKLRPQDSWKVEHAFTDIEGNVHGSFSGLKGNAQKSVATELANAQMFSINGKMNVEKAIQAREHLKDILISTSKKSIKEKEYYQDMTNILDNFINGVAKAHPDFGKAYNASNNIGKAIRGVETSRRAIDEAIKSPIVKSLGLDKLFKIPGLILNHTIPSEFFSYAWHSPKTAMNYMGKVIKSSVNGDVASTKRNMETLAKLIK